MSTETPRTDAFEPTHQISVHHWADFARSLERRNSELTAELEDLRQFKKEVDGEGVVPATRVLDIERQVSELTDCGVNREVDATCGKCIACLRESGRRNFNTATKLSQALGDEKAQVSELTAENKRLNGVALHMTACRALLNVPDDEVLYEAIRELTARIAELERSVNRKSERIIEAEKQLTEARKDSAWRPIQTAPKDGTEIMLWLRGEVAMAKWGGDFHRTWIHPARIMFFDGPSHWMPLPATPHPETEGTI